MSISNGLFTRTKSVSLKNPWKLSVRDGIIEKKSSDSFPLRFFFMASSLDFLPLESLRGNPNPSLYPKDRSEAITHRAPTYAQWLAYNSNHHVYVQTFNAYWQNLYIKGEWDRYHYEFPTLSSESFVPRSM